MLAQGPPLVFAAEEVAALQLGNARLRARGRSCSRCSPGISGSGPSSSKTEASQPKAIDKEAIRRRGARGCRVDARNITMGIWQLRSWLRRNCWIVGGVRPDRHVVFDGAAAPEKRPNSRAASALAELDRLAPCSNGFFAPEHGLWICIRLHCRPSLWMWRFAIGRAVQKLYGLAIAGMGYWRAPAPRGRGRATPAP